MTGTWVLIKLILRRDRLKLPLLIVGFVGLLLLIIPMLRSVYGDDASLATIYSAFGVNPAGLFMTGPMDGANFGSLMHVETLLWWGIALAFINTFFVIRHTRKNEEIGAQELLLSGQAHRTSVLSAALIVALAMNFLIAVLLGLGMMLMEKSWTTESAWLYATAMSLFGVVWATIAAVVAQLSENSRTSNSLLVGVVGLSFLLRGVGDFLSHKNTDGIFEAHWVSSVSPLGWLQATRPLTWPDWSPLVTMAISLAVLAVVAFFIVHKRDVGSGLIPARKGRVTARSSLLKQIGLTWYLQRGTFAGWLIGCLIMAATIGILVPQMSNVYEDSETLMRMIESMGGSGALIPSFLAAMLSMIALMVFAYSLHSLGKLCAEESSGRLEVLLSTKLSRLRWIIRHAGITVAGSAAMLTTSGLTLAIATNTASSVSINLMEYTLAGLSYLPLVLFFVGLYLLLFGSIPRLAGAISWTYYAFVAFMAWLGPLLNLGQAIVNLSVMTHYPSPPVDSVKTISVISVTLLSLIAIVTGLSLWRSRNLIER